MEHKYWAFLSYSHQDNLHERADGTRNCIRWAEWLHESLETWKVPPEFRSRQTLAGETMPDRFFPVFQDEKELPLNSDLAHSIRTALEQSRFLIVICSPRSARSFYVNEEVRYFKQLGRHDHILALIVDGEPNASEGNKPGVPVKQECFCLALRHPLDADGNVDQSVRDNQEPIAGDVRVKSGEHPREATGHDMKIHREVIDFMKLKLIAGLMGVGFDELAQRDKARTAAQARARVRRLAVLAGAFAVLGVAAIIAAILAFLSRNAAISAEKQAIAAQKEAVAQKEIASQQRDIASQQRDLAESREKEVRARLANLYEEKGRQALTEGDPATAAPYLVEAWKTYPERPELQLLVGMALQPLQGQRLVLDGHLGSIHHVIWSSDGKYLASADDVGSVRLWDAKTGQSITKFQMDTGVSGRDIVSLLFTPQNDFLVATNVAGTISLLNLAKPTDPPLTKKSGFYPLCAAVSPDGKLLATAGTAMPVGTNISIWQLPDLTNLASFDGGQGNSVKFSQDGKSVLVANADGTVRIWDWAAKTLTREIKGDGPMQKALFVLGDKFIVGTGTNNLLTMWDASSGASTLKIPPDLINSNLTNLEVSSDGHSLLAASFDRVMIGDLPSQLAKAQSLKKPDGSSIWNNAHFSSDGKLAILCPNSGKDTAVWDIATARPLAQLVGQVGDIYDAAFSPDGQQVAVAGRDQRIIVWDWPQVTVPSPLPSQDIYPEQALFGAADRIITVTYKNLNLWSESAGTLVKSIDHPADPSVGVGQVIRSAVSPDGLHIATAGDDRTVRLYDGLTGNPGFILNNDESTYSLDFSPDGSLLCNATPRNGQVRIWNVATGTQQALLPKKFNQLNHVQFDPTGHRLLVLTQTTAPSLWDVSSLQQLGELTADGIIQQTAIFSPDGSRIFTAASDHQIRAWNSASGKLDFACGPFVDQNAIMTCSPDGKILAFYSGGGTVFFYSTATGQKISQWDTPLRMFASSIQFWPNSHFAAVTVYNSLYFFDPDAGQLLAKYPGEGSLSSIHFTPDGTRVLMKEEKSARIIPLFRPLKDADAAAKEVDRLDRWKLVDGHLVTK